MIANVLLTVGDKTYRPGESIDKTLGKIDKEFLLTENYISLENKEISKSEKAVEIPKKDVKVLKNGSENKVIVDTEVK